MGLLRFGTAWGCRGSGRIGVAMVRDALGLPRFGTARGCCGLGWFGAAMAWGCSGSWRFRAAQSCLSLGWLGAVHGLRQLVAAVGWPRLAFPCWCTSMLAWGGRVLWLLWLPSPSLPVPPPCSRSPVMLWEPHAAPMLWESVAALGALHCPCTPGAPCHPCPPGVWCCSGSPTLPPCSRSPVPFWEPRAAPMLWEFGSPAPHQHCKSLGHPEPIWK